MPPPPGAGKAGRLNVRAGRGIFRPGPRLETRGVADGPEIDIPEIVAEVRAAFDRYEGALRMGDLDTLAELFWDSELTLRYGPNGTLFGHAAIDGFRRARGARGIDRTLRNTAITAFGRDAATANTEAVAPGSAAVTRQSQTWVRMAEGWRIVAAHVSELPGGG